MGYTPKGNTYRLTFEDDPDLEGLFVRVKALSLGAMFDMVEHVELLEEAQSSASRMRDSLPHVRKLFEQFAGIITEWNLEDDNGIPIPATAKGLFTQEFTFAMTMIKAYIAATSGASGPLENPLPDGVQSVVPSIPMETLSTNPVSL